MDDNARMRLWQEYAKHKSADIREKLILEYAPLVKLVAGRLSMYLGYNVEYEDLVSYGIFGLIDAIDKFEYTKAVKFETYASLRIRGAILDQIRKMDWIPRTIRQKQKQIDAAMKEFELTHGRQATDAELADQLGIKEEEFVEWQTQMKVTNVVSLNEFMEQGSDVANRKDASSHYAQPEEAGEAVDPNYVRFMPGLGLTDINILPHYQMVKDFELDGMRLYEEITRGDSFGNEFLVLPDGSYVLIECGEAFVWGEAYVMKDGEFYQICTDGERVHLG